MRVKEILNSFPDEIPLGGGALLRKAPGSAVHNRPFGKPAPAAEFTLNDGAIAVFPGTPPADEMEQGSVYLTPVYRQSPLSLAAVPTGKLFARFRSGTRAEEHERELRAAGFEILEVPPYAPEAAWVGHVTKDAAAALRDAEKLKEVPGIERVEPELLRAAARKGRG
jgi:hypothetical protein